MKICYIILHIFKKLLLTLRDGYIFEPFIAQYTFLALICPVLLFPEEAAYFGKVDNNKMIYLVFGPIINKIPTSHRIIHFTQRNSKESP